MASDVVLSSALRSNLLSLQNTQSLIDKTQLTLSTGRRVNSALDNPQNFFGAQSLNNRASDLSRLLDGLGQSISAIEQADNAVEALTTLVQQADSVAQQARDALAAGAQEAKIQGDVRLDNVDTLTDRTGIDDGDEFTISYIDTNDTVVDHTITIKTTVAAADQVQSGEELVTEINGIRDSAGNQVFEAGFDAAGNLQITELTGQSFQLDFNDGASSDPELASALGFGAFDTQNFEVEPLANSADLTRITIGATNALTTVSLYDVSDDKIADRTTILDNISSKASGAVNDVFQGGPGDGLQIAINGGTLQTVFVEPTTATVQDLIDGINTNNNLNQQIEASFDEASGQITIRAISADVTSIKFSATDTGADEETRVDLLEMGIGLRNLYNSPANVKSTETITLGSAAGQLAELENEYENIRTQIDQLVDDSSFRGTNLLNGDDLITVFNEERTNSLTTEGVIFTSAGLGLSEVSFARSSTVENALDEVAGALNKVRSFGGTLANDLSIIQTRQNFTQATINTLSGAADKLTIADQNEEGAKLLALQTRQQLGVTSLALASQSQQAVLRLF
jgi:flagellin